MCGQAWLCLSMWVNGRMMEGVQCDGMVDGVALGQAIQTTFLTSGTQPLRRPSLVFRWAHGVPVNRAKLPATEDVHHGAVRFTSVVVGVFVYSLFSKSGAFGSLDLLFTVEAMIFAQTCLILPLVWGGSWTAFEGVGQSYSDTLSTLGINHRQRLVWKSTGQQRRLSRHRYRLWSCHCRGGCGDHGRGTLRENQGDDDEYRARDVKRKHDAAALLGVLLLALSLSLVALASVVKQRRRKVSTVWG